MTDTKKARFGAAFYRRLAQVVFLALSQGESTDTVLQFVLQNSVRLPVILDPERSAGRAYGVSAIPTTFVIDRDGVIRFKRRGGLLPGELDLALQPLLH